ncbi:helicase associated domain-containing protein [[Micrococcus luteus] ATCC 49442]|uniref:helicase associated domain-containing protein n=1 Tax=[Micrococcus luteus] ATCC 49442 TaxID=2698727 RepID=UPI001FCB4091|nr:helicase associated domain-containing protein [[Micrococcus luteus] ATCC 49442]
MAETTVRYHLAIAARLQPSIREEHRDAATTLPRILPAGRQNLEDILDLYKAEGRLPTTAGSSARERALGVWLHRRRQEAEQGVLSPVYKEALDVIPGWHRPSTKKSDDEARWKQRLSEVIDFLASANDWPRHNKTGIKEERVLGVWLHVQRINHRAGRLDPAKEAQLNAVIPGWRQGRSKGRRPRSEAQQHTTH